ncbi:MAG TPA: glycoside hydrolase family 78 protein [Vicinamibacterales bacterium]|nr:glycoside hydrolase family 78 protein [Vicinamibacterales bacterium]
MSNPSRITFVVVLAFMAASVGLARQAPAARQNPLLVTALRTEHAENPIGIDVAAPRLSWQIRASARGVIQASYQIRVASTERALAAPKGLVWDSGIVSSEESAYRPYTGPPLQSGRRYYWQVRVWDRSGQASDWSQAAFWEMGLLTPADWKASWIEPGLQEDVTKSGPAPMLRREFVITGPIERARVYVTSHGMYEMELNGRRVGDAVLTPGWTSYHNRLQYQTYDVTSQLQKGRNAIGVTLGNGWYRGNLAWADGRNHYGERLALLAQLVLTYRGGKQEVVGTDAGWKAATGPILMSEIYHGETYDARLEKPGWSSPGFADADWSPVKVADYPKTNLVAPAGPPVRRIEELKPVQTIRTPAGETVVDMGQNMVGWVRLKVQGPAGATVRLRHAEVLDKQGNFYTENLRGAKQTVEYTLKGAGVETFEPHFTFQGFRYVAVEGFPGELAPDSLTGVVVHSDMARTGAFETSKPLVNQLQHNIVWGQKGNFVDVPTDCPQRDERLGWTGDAQVFARTAAFNMDVAGFFTKWLRDVAADQLPSGSVPHVVPDILSRPDRPSAGSAAWADAAVIIPWTMYLSYGDKRLLETQYPSMMKWVEYIRKRAGDDYIWSEDFAYGDWLAYASTASDYPGATTGKDLIATAFFAHSTDLVSRAARVIGRNDDAATYETLLGRIKNAFVREFVTATGRVGENTQTAYAVALQFDLLPEAMRAGAAARLAREINQRKHLTTGFVGTPYLLHVLARYGYLDEAYLLLNRETYPSWLYPVKQGATTIWERWDGLKPDGTFQDKGMNSFNHYAYGAVGEWMYRVMAGLEIDPAAPAYKHALIQPRPGGGFTSVKASHDTPYGVIGSAWTLKDGQFELVVDVPPNTSARVWLPGAKLASVTEGGQPLAAAPGIKEPRQEGTAVLVEVGSGQYRFAYPLVK